MKRRIEWVDIVKAICMLLIMVTHLECKSNVLLAYYQPIYVAGFFLCSGYCYSDKYTFKELIKVKARTLLLPWLIYSNINILISHIKSIKDHNSLLTELFHNLLQIRYFDDRLWFLTALFMAFIPFYFIVKWIKKDKNPKSVIIFIILLFFIKKAYSYFVPDIPIWMSNRLPWNIDYIPTALFSMSFGYLIKERYETKIDKMKISLFLLITMIYFVTCFVTSKVNVYSNFLVYSITDFFGQGFGLLFLVICCKKIRINKYLSFIGQNTLVYFCIHNKFLTLFEYVVIKFLPQLYNSCLLNEGLKIILSFTIAFIVSLILIIPTKFINRYLPFTLGKLQK